MNVSQIVARLATPCWFGLVGLSGAIVDLTCFCLLGRVLPIAIARGLAIWVAMSWNFLLNRRLTFADARRDSMGRQYLLFCAACALGAAVNWGATIALCLASPLFAAFPAAAALVGIAAGTVLNYLASRYFVFRPSLPATSAVLSAPPAILLPAQDPPATAVADQRYHKAA